MALGYHAKSLIVMLSVVIPYMPQATGSTSPSHINLSQNVFWVAQLVPLSRYSEINNDTHYPTKLLCPAENKRWFELVSRTKGHVVARVRSDFTSGAPGQVTLDLSEHGQAFTRMLDTSVDKSISTEQYARGIRQKHAAIFNRICIGNNEDRAEFQMMLDRNEKILDGVLTED